MRSNIPIPIGFARSGPRLLGLALALGLVLVRTSLSGAQLPGPSPQVRKNEIKLFVNAANAEQAMKALKLDEHRSVKQIVCFFDTADRALEANDLILRARQKEGGPGESTVKLRAIDGATALSDAERAIQPEQDWTNENRPTLSRSVDHASWAKGLVPKVAAGQVAVAEIFDETQRKLVMARMKDFDWKSLRLYGPVDARVWRQQWKLQGFPENVTVELWHLQKDGRTQDVLELSAKAWAETDTEARALACRFFGAAKAAGFGAPAGQTKTKAVLDFFKPGRRVGNETAKANKGTRP